MFTYLQRLVNERTSLTEAMTGLSDRAATEERDLSDSERTSITGMQTRCVEIDAQISEGQSQLESQHAYAGLLQRIEGNRETAAEQRSGSLAVMERTAPQRLVSPGEAFVTAPAFTEYRGVGQSGRVDIADYLETRATITTAQLAIDHFKWAPVERTYTSPLLDSIAHVSVSAGVVDWVEVGPDPLAAVVPEGQPKPEAAFTMTPQTSALDTLAHWVQITRQALDDASYIRSLIETKLRRGLIKKAEQDVAAAIVAAALETAEGGTLLESIRVGIGTVEANGYSPNAVLLNPADWAALDIAVMVESVDGPQRKANFWGLTPVASNDIAAGTAIVGDMTAGVTLFDRGVSSVFMSDSHAALFISNILVILAETRVKTAVTDPLALVECSAAATP